MNPEIKKQWVAALRSGEFKQGKAALRNGDTFCCLGVLCELHRRANGGEWERNEEDDFLYHDNRSFLPEDVWEWAGLVDNNPVVARTSLTGRNDNGASF